ncbi:MAG: hydroxymethylglutaryl-CoA reductase (NADPH) [Methanosarcinales archaeon]|jgi:hydroxymethylglutaryl-CoA reductase (NADPH)|nr:hydroxymethylglutaryl-CoA reductase (NADPH) [Methanosarcinales archaeon]
MSTTDKLTADEKALLEKMISGEISLRKIEEYLDKDGSAKLRRAYLESLKNVSFDHISTYTFDTETVAQKNIENLIGAIQIPLGVAGEIQVNGEYAQGNYYLPLATPEGALVASVNRGCSIITKSGGATVRVFKNMMTRAPVFKFDSLEETKDFYDWVMLPETFDKMKKVADATTRFGELLEVQPFVSGNNVHLRLGYDTKDAMGMNMITIASEAITKLIADEKGVPCVSLSGNMCTDKKPTAINAILGRGKTVIAEARLPASFIQDTLKCTAESMFDANYRKNFIGSMRAGALGFNAHAANIVAAIFLACGQDPAHVVEGSLCITEMDLAENGDLICSVTMPAVEVGTVGGGTTIATQQECLKLLDVAGAGAVPGENALALSEIVTAAVLAGEISLVAAQAAGHLARAHSQLGR